LLVGSRTLLSLSGAGFRQVGDISFGVHKAVVACIDMVNALQNWHGQCTPKVRRPFPQYRA